MKAKARPCRAKTKDGKPCKVQAQSNSDFCTSHDPERQQEMSAKRKSVWNSYLKPKDVGPPPTTAKELILVLGETINHVRTNKLDPNRGKCVAELCRVAYKLVGSYEEDVKKYTSKLEKMSDEELLDQIALLKKEVKMADA